MPETGNIEWVSVGLGTKPDAQVARNLGMSKSAVGRARRRLGIAAFDQRRVPKGIDWDAQPLGEVSDTELAKCLGVAAPVIVNARQRRGIPALNPRQIDVDWKALPLGEYPDAALAKLLGVSEPTVSRARNRLGIVPFKHSFLTSEGEAANYPEALIDLYWHEHGIAHAFQVSVGPYVADWILERREAVEYAGFADSQKWGRAYKERLREKIRYYRAHGLSVRVIWSKDLVKYDLGKLPRRCRDPMTRRINWTEQPLGRQSDTALAERLGLSQSTVSKWRRKLGIPTHTPPMIDWDAQPLGQVVDRVLAEKLGVSKETVRRARVARGILARRRRHA